MTSDPFRILFVCSGNSCRSPMAEGLMKAKIPSRLRNEIEVKSAGTLGIDGMPATKHAISVVNDMGGDISRHISQGVSPELVQKSDLILAMAGGHVDYLHQHFPAYRENVFLMKRFASEQPVSQPEIEDPVGQPLPVYQQCAQIINEEIDRIMPAVVKMVQERRHRT